jgi:hypothetical protein
MGCTPVRTHTVHPFPHMTCAAILEHSFYNMHAPEQGKMWGCTITHG